RAFEDQTIRHVVHVSVGGRRVRVRLSNTFGAAPLLIGSAHVALHGDGASIVPGSDRTLTFSGQPSITIPTGALALSDPVNLDVPARGDLAVSVYVPENTGPATFHESSEETAYISAPGDFTGSADVPVAEATVSRFWLSAVEVSTREEVGTLVTLGDSITEGFQSTIDAHRSWPDLLSARLNPRSGPPRLAVMNQGIGCSRLLFDFCGPNGAGRFDRDVLAVTGVTQVIVAYGLNDIGLPIVAGIPSQVVSASTVIVGLSQLIERAHEKGLAIYGATITPVGTSIYPGFFTPENEAKRQAVNRWIRTSRKFDGVIDFDRAVRDPGQPNRLLAAYDSGDGVHPSDAGYAAMANAIDLSLFR
ncbi:MAG TPA: SGNH/GDSL hydrolase family protein, partial [Vicinamibacterales bacterium]|nr:SGNH/GDSL hydrolase family protein [Vicinamibacterales bacterium]